jgi:hypothetical protein
MYDAVSKYSQELLERLLHVLQFKSSRSSLLRVLSKRSATLPSSLAAIIYLSSPKSCFGVGDRGARLAFVESKSVSLNFFLQ